MSVVVTLNVTDQVLLTLARTPAFANDLAFRQIRAHVDVTSRACCGRRPKPNVPPTVYASARILLQRNEELRERVRRRLGAGQLRFP